MRVLLDTHAFLWFIIDDSNLSPAARTAITDENTAIAIRPATYWEIAIKIRLGKYALPLPFEEFFDTHLAANDFEILPILPRHAAQLTTMPFHHRDPFDRLLVAQALSEGILLVSGDSQLDAYRITRLW